MDIYEGQRFYRNTKDVANGVNLPDYLIIKKIIRHRDGSLWLIRAEYENHHVGERYKMFNVEILLSSNLNPFLKGTPLYIFKEGIAAYGQA